MKELISEAEFVESFEKRIKVVFSSFFSKLILSHPMVIISLMNEPHNSFDNETKFLQAAGWTFDCCQISKNGEVLWQVEAFRGRRRFVVRHKTMKQAVRLMRAPLLSC